MKTQAIGIAGAYENVEITTFQSGITGKYCYLLSGGIEDESGFRFYDHAEAYIAGVAQIKQRCKML